MNANDLSPGDYVEHCFAPGTIWRIVHLEPYTPNGGNATLQWVGGKQISYEKTRRIFNTYITGSTTRILNLREPNPMLVLAVMAK